MPRYELYLGDNPLWCHIGIHQFENSKCVYCYYSLNPEVIKTSDQNYELEPFVLE